MTDIATRETSEEVPAGGDLRTVARARARRDRRRRDWLPAGPPSGSTLAAFLLPAALVVYLGLESGGFVTLVYSQLGIAAWWIVLLGALAGVFASAGVGRRAWVGFGLLAAFAVWTLAGVSWSPSSERSMIEVGRVLAYLGVLALALATAGRERTRAVLAGVGAGCAVVATVALLSRLEPGWFPANELADVLPATESRLAYPLNYWNGLAGLIAVGFPLVVWVATSARAIPARALAAAFVPLMALTSYYTLSRGGAIATAIGVLAAVALSTRRLALLPPLAVMAAGSAALIWAADRRPSLQSGRVDDIAVAQGHRMVWIVIGVGLLAAVAVGVHALLARRGRLPAAPRVPRRAALAAAAAAVVVAIGAFTAFDGAGRADDAWERFKEPSNPGAQVDRLSSASGNGRWQYWSAAIDAFEDQPLHGIGPGTFVFWWSQHRDIPGFIRDAHSLFAEVLGELGVVGLLLLASFIALVIAIAARGALRASGRGRRALAAGGGAAVAFAVAAGIDWLWELAVIPVAFLFVAAAVLRDGDGPATPAPASGRRLVTGAAATLVAAAAIALIAIPMVGADDVADSQAAFRAGDYETSLAKAEDASDLQPYAASPYVQQAFALEALGREREAVAAARRATEAESTNWETWYVLARIQVGRGEREAALRALRQAQRLDPLNPILNPEATEATPTSAPSG